MRLDSLIKLYDWEAGIAGVGSNPSDTEVLIETGSARDWDAWLLAHGYSDSIAR